MSDAKADPAVGGTVEASNRPVQVSISQIFLEFLTIGATSFGGAVPYLRGDLVTKRHWLSEKEFVEMLSLSQSLPGLNVTNMAILVGQKLGGAPGSIAAILGVCLPGAVIMLVAGILYRIHGGRLSARVKTARIDSTMPGARRESCTGGRGMAGRAKMDSPVRLES